MGIPLGGGNFTRGAAVPIDDSMTTATLITRDAIPSGIRFQGMCVFVLSDTKTYQLKAGITNADWVEYGGGGGGGAVPVVDSATGNGVTTAFTVTNAPGTKENINVYLDGDRQSTAHYSVSGTTVTFSTAPYNGAEIQFVTGATYSVGTPSNDTVTQDKLPAKTVHATAATLGVVLKTANCGTMSVSTQTDIVNASGTLVSKGRPVKLALQPNDDGNTSAFDLYSAGAGGDTRIGFWIYRNGSIIAKIQLGGFINATGVSAFRTEVPTIDWLDVNAPAGTNTYKMAVVPVGQTVGLVNYCMIAYEI